MKTDRVIARSQRLAGKTILAFAILIPMCEVSPGAAQSCGATGVAVQVLGSGGPELLVEIRTAKETA